MVEVSLSAVLLADMAIMENVEMSNLVGLCRITWMNRFERLASRYGGLLFALLPCIYTSQDVFVLPFDMMAELMRNGFLTGLAPIAILLLSMSANALFQHVR